MVGCREQCRGERSTTGLTEVTVSHNKRRERVGLEAGEQRDARSSVQVVQPVTVLECLHLTFKDEVVRRTEISLEGALLFRDASDPEINLFHTRDRESVCAGRPSTLASHEIGRIRRYDNFGTRGNEPRGLTEKRIEGDATHQLARSMPTFFDWSRLSGTVVTGNAVLTRNKRMGPVGSYEVNKALVVPEVVGVVDPALVRSEGRITGLLEEKSSRSI